MSTHTDPTRAALRRLASWDEMAGHGDPSEFPAMYRAEVAARINLARAALATPLTGSVEPGSTLVPATEMVCDGCTPDPTPPATEPSAALVDWLQSLKNPEYGQVRDESLLNPHWNAALDRLIGLAPYRLAAARARRTGGGSRERVGA